MGNSFITWLTGVILLLTACSTPPPPESAVTTAGQCLGPAVFEAPPLNACAGKRRLRVTIAGDVLLHRQLAELGYSAGFASVWAQASPFLQGADITIANLEGPVAPGVSRAGRQVGDPGPVYGVRDVYTAYPLFNYHPRILRDLKTAGVDLVTTANNHAMDRGAIGADLTLSELEQAGTGAIGTIRGGGARDFALRRQTALGTVSFVACSFSTNGNADPRRQVLLCYDNRSELLALVRREAADPAVVGVIVLPHWGQEYVSAADARQTALARDLAAAGATAIVGTHPHAVQPFTTMMGKAGRRIPVAYSTGNFIAVQNSMPSRVGALALLDLCRGGSGQGLVAENFGWVAGQMEFTPRGYWFDIAPKGTSGARGLAQRHLGRIAPGLSAQPQACQ